MPEVRRFRTLGQIRRIGQYPLNGVKDISASSAESSLSVSVRKVRSDKKHQYPLRVQVPLWVKINELALSCRDAVSGPSLNEILCLLLEFAVKDDAIISQVKDRFPERREIVLVRSWGN